MTCVGHAVSVWSDVDMIVEVLRRQDAEIELGWRFWPRKADTERMSSVLLGALKQHVGVMLRVCG